MDDEDDNDEEKIMSEFIKKLQSYYLFTLQSRIYNKLLMFAHSIKTNSKSPSELKSLIVLPAPDDYVDTLDN